MTDFMWKCVKKKNNNNNVMLFISATPKRIKHFFISLQLRIQLTTLFTVYVFILLVLIYNM